MKEQKIEVMKNYNLKTDGKYCMYAHIGTVSSIYSPTSSYDVVIKCRYLDKSNLKCNLFEKDLKETKLEKIKRCKECLSSKIIN
jgi:hypothetical protein